jgi:hypothetical protein
LDLVFDNFGDKKEDKIMAIEDILELYNEPVSFTEKDFPDQPCPSINEIAAKFARDILERQENVLPDIFDRCPGIRIIGQI